MVLKLSHHQKPNAFVHLKLRLRVVVSEGAVVAQGKSIGKQPKLKVLDVLPSCIKHQNDLQNL